MTKGQERGVLSFSDPKPRGPRGGSASLEAEQQPGGVTMGDLTADVAAAQLNLLEWAGWQDWRGSAGHLRSCQ